MMDCDFELGDVLWGYIGRSPDNLAPGDWKPKAIRFHYIDE
jgi:hypothetical protein